MWFKHPVYTYWGFVPSFSERSMTSKDSRCPLLWFLFSISCTEPCRWFFRSLAGQSHFHEPGVGWIHTPARFHSGARVRQDTISRWDRLRWVRLRRARLQLSFLLSLDAKCFSSLPVCVFENLASVLCCLTVCRTFLSLVLLLFEPDRARESILRLKVLTLLQAIVCGLLQVFISV
jgi:hypothetical protein